MKEFYEVKLYDEDGDSVVDYYQNIENANKDCERIITNWYNEGSLNYDRDVHWTLENWLDYWRARHEIYERLELNTYYFADYYFVD